MCEIPGIQLPIEDNCEALFGQQISANIMLQLLRKLNPTIASDKIRMAPNTLALPHSYKSWSSLTVSYFHYS